MSNFNRFLNATGVLFVGFGTMALLGCNHGAEESPPTTAQSADTRRPTPSDLPTTDSKSENNRAGPNKPDVGDESSLVAPHNQAIPADLGEPLVDNPSDLRRLETASPVWIDKKHKQVVLMGTACKADYPLEFFATYPDRSYESVVAIYTRPSVVHAALLALGAKPGKPVQYRPTFAPPTGTEVEIDVCWKNKDGKRQRSPAQQLVRDTKTKQPMDINWVFAGSLFWDNAETGGKSYLADRGDFITVLNVPTALLDVPIESESALESRLFESVTERLPPPGTPVTLILKPKVDTPSR